MDNQDIICYFVTKHSIWKGKYKRVFSFGTNGVTTYDPDTLEITNRWAYNDISSIKRRPEDNKFTITGKKEKTVKVETMIFSTEHRAELLTVASDYRHYFTEKPYDLVRYEALKHHWSGTRLPILLDITPATLNQLDTATNVILASYLYKDIEAIYDVSDINFGFVVVMKQFGRMHLFISTKREELKSKIQEYASSYLGIDIKVHGKTISLQFFLNNKFGKYSEDDHTTSIIEFYVDKVETKRYLEATRRLLCLTQSCIVERDPETYHIVTLRPLESIFAIVRDPVNPRQFIIEYRDMEASNTRTYDGANRDSILATLLDGVRGAGNKNVHVKMKLTARGKRFGPYYSSPEQEVETMHLKFLKNSAGKKGMIDMIERFNCNIPYSGLLHSVTQDGLFKENKEKPILEALQAISSVKANDIECMCEEELEALYHAIRRLVSSKSGFSSFSQIPGFRENLGLIVLAGVKRNSEAMTHAALDMICALMHPMHDDCDIKQEQLNKSSLLSNSAFLNGLLDKWTHYVNNDSGALVVSAMLDFLTFSLCTPYSETTEGRHFDSLLEMVAQRGRSLFKHFQHPCTTIVKGASLIMGAIIEEGEPDVASKMQELSLNEGALPRHLISSFFTTKSDQHKLTQCRLSRHLVSLWLTNNDNGMKLMERILPAGLLCYLQSKEIAPVSHEFETTIRDNLKLAQDHANKNQVSPQFLSIEKKMQIIEKHLEDTLVHWGTRLGFEKRRDKVKTAPVVLRKSRQRIKSTLNWNLFYYNFNKDHSLPNLIWNHKTREELKNALEKEVRAFESDREISRGNLIAWNHAEFEVHYPSLKDQLCIDGYYIKILLDKEQAPDSLASISDTFFYNLYHRFLLGTSSDVKCMCLHALTIVYGHFYTKIQYFSDTKYLITMLQMTFSRVERDRLLFFLHKLTFNKENVKDIIDSNGIPVLVELTTLAHLHTTRAMVPTQTNVLEFKPNESRNDEEKEWHYQNVGDKKPSDRQVSFKELKMLFSKGIIFKESKCWAQGMQNWTPMQNIPQLKWCLLGKGNSLMNESELAILILNMLITMMEYYPSRNEEDAIIWPICKLKQILSSSHCLPHLVQLLLTFDPIIVEKVATLLCHIAQDNAQTPKLYMTGVFYFILMYNGSNVLPIAKFLQMTHAKQAFRGDETQSMELMQRSILGQLLPEAMVNYLENYGAEKFAQIFLGEYDSPEVIWNSEMRGMLIQKIAAHIADFTPRLWSNNKALYQHAIIPAIRYPQLDCELFCNIYYLKHLCDTSRFPDWPINDPVTVLRDVLEAWKFEVEKKPLAMSIDDAYKILEISFNETPDETTVRKAYYKLAQKYHPDKNLDGREKFEDVNKAYDFLCSRRVWMETGINLNNIKLIIKTQSILFFRYSPVLQPYKYAGYHQLIKTIQLEIDDDLLFSKKIILLPSAVELIYYTIKCSALNAEEFNRNNGFQVSSLALSRCVSTLSDSTNETDFASQVCLFSAKSFMIAAAFENCLVTFNNLSNLIPDLVRILHFKNLVKLCCSVVECISALAKDVDLQLKLFQSGILWYIIPFIFLYDYTLEECGIESSQDNNQQESWNELSKLSCKACSCLAGYNDQTSESPHNNAIRSVLSSLLTKFIVRSLAEEEPKNVLKVLNSNCESPYLIWNNATRIELLEFLEARKRSICTDNNYDDIDFSFTSHKKELIIGDIFIRLYNEQPAFELKNPKEFAMDLLDYLKKMNLNLCNEGSVVDEKSIVMAVIALYNVIHHNLGVEIQCIGSFKTLFSLLSIKCKEPIQINILKVLSLVTRNQECINDIASSGVLIHLILILYGLPEYRNISLECFLGVITSSHIVKDFFSSGGLLYLLDILFNSNVLDTRVKAAEALGRLIDDKISGPRIKLTLTHIVPSIICDAMRDSPAQAVNLLETYQETPEIIWTEEDRSHIASILSEQCSNQFQSQKQNPSNIIQITDLGSLHCRENKDLIIGGVYIHLFNINPAWDLHKPVYFLTELFDTFLKQMRSHAENLEIIGTALVNLLSFHPRLIDQVPSLGLLPKLFSLWILPNILISQFCFKILNQLFMSESCVESLRNVDCLLVIKNAMNTHPEVINIGCDTLHRLFAFKQEPLIKQAVEVNLVSFMLHLLEENLSAVENPARTKAIIAKTLKIMAESVAHGTAINALLEKSPVWSSYNDQKLDLFITNSTSPKYLTGGPTSTSGYLTQGNSPTLLNTPPPVSKDDST
nr:dnaJ homolog subfamily C member 13 [Halyomorpha halys]